MIRDVRHQDVEYICRIYNEYVKHTVITFEEEVVSEEAMYARIEKIKKDYCYIVYEMDGEVVGYAYASAWRTRSAYRFCVESTVYVEKNAKGKGIGTALYQELINRLKLLNFRVIMGVIALPNEPSVRLHEKLGFYEAGYFKKVGLKFNQWIDVGYWQYDIV
ncbi:N-acetyltransferase family protein [Vallitalea pronyensis]|uniref:N-acetyltransferase family protein n=1 Tax=Vallitalea pronyensis TaxID=1348613 RepID=A0A8J8SH84_9FIRM|nr:GNAT family N-acetyltransferase [Vallitalea pronyensis]QUI23605.1 N-acetyltransferase family protein [Vallitalea pronyensis]